MVAVLDGANAPARGRGAPVRSYSPGRCTAPDQPEQARSDLRAVGVLGLVSGQQDSLGLLHAQTVRDQARKTFTAIVAVTITDKGHSQPFELAQAEADLAAGDDQD